MNKAERELAKYTFDQVCKGFYPHSERDYPNARSWMVGIASRFTTKKSQPLLKAYLDELLSGQYTDAELFEIFRSTNPTFSFRSKNPRPWMIEIRSIVADLISKDV